MQAAMQIARDRHQTLSRTVASLLRAALASEGGSSDVELDAITGQPTVRVGRPVTAADVAAADDDG